MISAPSLHYPVNIELNDKKAYTMKKLVFSLAAFLFITMAAHAQDSKTKASQPASKPQTTRAESSAQPAATAAPAPAQSGARSTGETPKNTVPAKKKKPVKANTFRVKSKPAAAPATERKQ